MAPESEEAKSCTPAERSCCRAKDMPERLCWWVWGTTCDQQSNVVENGLFQFKVGTCLWGLILSFKKSMIKCFWWIVISNYIKFWFWTFADKRDPPYETSKWVSHGVTNEDKCGFPLPGSVHSCAHPSACYANWHELWAPQPCRDEPSPVRSPLPEKSAVLEPSVLCKSISKRGSRWFDMTGAIVSRVPLYDFHTFTFTNILAPCQSGSRPFPRWSCHSRSPTDQLWQSMCNVPQCDIQPGCRCGSLLPTERANGKIIAFFWFLCF